MVSEIWLQKNFMWKSSKIKKWFNLVQNMNNKYNMFLSNIWNFDKSKFVINVLKSSIVVIGIDSINKQLNIQSKNWKWIITIEIINAENVVFFLWSYFKKNCIKKLGIILIDLILISQ